MRSRQPGTRAVRAGESRSGPGIAGAGAELMATILMTALLPAYLADITNRSSGEPAGGLRYRGLRAATYGYPRHGLARDRTVPCEVPTSDERMRPA
ncbi:MAG: hypothetical protein OEW59_02810 [Gammaproteobacteria bacterium]|nr:hypothetical protein [Gammaproteobacteria bacterium]